jgi:hypothetical protein
MGKTDLAQMHWQKAIALDPYLEIAKDNLFKSIQKEKG